MGLLHGVPLTLKDCWATAGIRTTAGSPEMADCVADAEAEVVARLRSAGAIVMGKTNVPEQVAGQESGNPVFGRRRNPEDPDGTPGGSPGGAAAAVAAGLSPLEVGSDSGGSIREPAHCCGVFGHFSTSGLVPLARAPAVGAGRRHWCRPGPDGGGAVGPQCQRPGAGHAGAGRGGPPRGAAGASVREAGPPFDTGRPARWPSSCGVAATASSADDHQHDRAVERAAGTPASDRSLAALRNGPRPCRTLTGNDSTPAGAPWPGRGPRSWMRSTWSCARCRRCPPSATIRSRRTSTVWAAGWYGGSMSTAEHGLPRPDHAEHRGGHGRGAGDGGTGGAYSSRTAGRCPVVGRRHADALTIAVAGVVGALSGGYAVPPGFA